MPLTVKCKDIITQGVVAGLGCKAYEIGVGTGSPSESGLGNEVARKPILEVKRVANKVRLSTVFGTDEANATLTEVALFDLNGDVLWYAEISPAVEKTSAYELLIMIEFELTI